MKIQQLFKKNRTIIIVMTSMVAVFIALHLIIYNLTRYVLEQHMMNTVQGVAVATAQIIENDIERYISFMENPDITSDYYLEMNTLLSEIKDSGSLAYVYTTRLVNGEWEFVLCGSPIGDEEDWSAPGDEDGWDSGKEQVIQGAQWYSAGQLLRDSEWGELIYAYAAIRDSNGEIISLAGADISGEYFFNYLNTVQGALYIFYIASLFVAWVVIVHFSKKGKQAQERLTLMLDSSPLCAQIWARDLSTIDCNEAGVRLYKFKDKAEYIARFLTECSAEIQPCGQRAEVKAVALVNRAFDEGYCQFEWLHRIPDDDLLFPAEVTLVRAKYKDQDVVIGYTRDLREEHRIKAQSQSTLEAILNSMDSYIYATVPETGELLFVNNNLKKLMGIDRDVIGEYCYKVFRQDFEEKCDFCPCHQLADEPDKTIVWDEYIPPLNMHIRHSDRLIDWPDGRKVHLQHAVDITDMMKTQEALHYRESLMKAVNQSAVLLLDYDVDYFENALFRSMVTIAEAVKVDCLYIWKNHLTDKGLHCSQLYEWSKTETMYSKDAQLYAYNETFPGWDERLSAGDCINGPIKDMSEAVQDLLSPGGIVSILVVPIFIKDEFWGFVGFDDNKNERVFLEEEVSILNSASLLIASSFIHNDMIHNMRETAEQIQRQSKLTEAVNAAAMLLLTAEESEDIKNPLLASMELVGISVNADRVHIWRNEEIDGEEHFVNIYQWNSDVGKQKTDVPQRNIMTPCSMMSEWREKFKRGKYVGGGSSLLTPEEKEYFASFDVKSVVLIPLFLNEVFWGLVSVDNCTTENEFTEEEISILRSVSLMMASAINRDKMLHDTRHAADKLREKDNLLQAVNKASEILLNTKESEDMEDMVSVCMEYVGNSINADRIYIWQSSHVDGEFFHTSSYYWDSEIAKDKSRVPRGTQLSFKKAVGITLWDEKFLNNEVVTAVMSDSTESERSVLGMFDIKAVTIIPMFLEEQLWGIFCIGDCEYEKVHTEEEVAILRSVSLMMANAINLHQLIEKRTYELATQTATLSTLLDSIPDLIFTKNAELGFTHCNKALLKHFDIRLENIVGKNDAEALGMSAEMEDYHRNKDLKVMQEGKAITIEEHLPRADGSMPLYETTVVPLVLSGETIGVVGIARDITERKAMERKLTHDYEYAAKLNDSLALITNSATISSGELVAAAEIIAVEGCHTLDVHYVGVWTLLENGNGLESVTYYCAASGEHTIQPTYDLTLARRQRYKEMLENERIITMTNLEDCKGIFDGFGIYEPTNLNAALDAPIRIDGKLVGVICVEQERCEKYPDGREWLIEEQNFASSLADLMALAISGHERRKARDAAERANQSKSAFIANISHEIRTPMNVIMGLTELMMDEDETSDSARDYLEKIHTSGSTLTSIINDILDISKMESGKFTLTPVSYQLASMLNDVATFNVIKIDEKPITFSLEIDDGLYAYLHGDDLRVRQILNNLLSNAFKYTKKGAVTLKVSCERENDTDVKLMISVSDTGMGIRKEDADRLFKDYHQVDAQANRKIEGTGLGLSITKKLTELMSGEISFESVHGLGSIFRIVIRQGYISDELVSAETIENLREFRYEDKKTKSASALVRPDLSYAKVLVVDDFPTNLDVAKGMLGKYKMKIDCVMSGQEAIDSIIAQDKLPAGAPRYDAIFMDHMMPGMDGIEAAERIRALGTDYALNIPIIALTANAAVGNEEMFLSKGFQAFLSKPINVTKLDAAVRKWIMDDTRHVGGGDSVAPETSLKPDGRTGSSAPTPKSDEIPGVNMKLGLSLYEDDMEMYVEIMKSYAENIPSELEKLHGVSQENLGDYAIDIHTIKGAFAGIGAKELSLRAKEMELMAKSGDLSGVQAVNEQFIEDAHTLISCVKIWLEDK